MKKVISILAITLLMVGMTDVTAFAHGGHGKGNGAQQQLRYEQCTVDGCNVLGVHQHNGIWYCNQTGREGSYEVCTVEGCTQLGLHEHDGVYYYCSFHGTGRGCGKGLNQ